MSTHSQWRQLWFVLVVMVPLALVLVAGSLWTIAELVVMWIRKGR